MIRVVIVALGFAACALGTRAADSPALDLARQLNNAFIEVADKVSPSVVVIKVAQRDQGMDLDADSPFWELVPKEFRRRMQEEREKTRPERKRDPGEKLPLNGQGSGVIISDDGYILTNFHVVEDVDRIVVRLRDGRTFPATVRGTDPQSDVAVIKIVATNLPVAKLGDSDAVRVGEFSVAIGAPFELDYSVTYGHVSAKGRSHVITAYGPNSPGASMDQDFIQTDASINPGNSGGPLVNLYGEVIGINTLIRGLHTGIGFAIPANLAREVSARLIADGKFSRAWLGIGIRGLREDDEAPEVIPGVQDGVLVTDLRPDGPAIKSDLKLRDVITAVDGKAVTTSMQLRNAVRTKAGTNVVLDVVRVDDKRRARNMKVKVVPEPWPEKPIKVAAKSSTTTPGDLGFAAGEITSELQAKFRAAETNGVVVTEVIKDSLAAPNIRVGDVILAINHHPVKTMQELNSALAGASLAKGILFEMSYHGNKRSEILRHAIDAP